MSEREDHARALAEKDQQISTLNEQQTFLQTEKSNVSSKITELKRSLDKERILVMNLKNELNSSKAELKEQNNRFYRSFHETKEQATEIDQNLLRATSEVAVQTAVETVAQM